MKGLSNDVGLRFFDFQIQRDMVAVMWRVDCKNYVDIALSGPKPGSRGAMIVMAGGSRRYRRMVGLVRRLEGVKLPHFLSLFFVPIVGGAGRVEVGL